MQTILTNNNTHYKNKFFKGTDYQDFISQFPVVNFNDLEPYILEQKRNGTVELCPNPKKYQPTSGSTSARKWIPYNQALLQEFDRAIGPWLYSLYQKFPKILQGKHYWSLSWLPDDLRSEGKNLDDLGYFSLPKQVIMRLTMALPNKLSTLKKSQDHKLLTMLYLISTKELSMISVWSPTYFINLLEEMLKEKKTLLDLIKASSSELSKDAEVLRLKLKNRKNIHEQFALFSSLSRIDELHQLWPRLALISSWDTSTSRDFAEVLKSYFPKVSFQGKGLFATEGVLSFPYNDRYLLSYQSHFYEFECQLTKKIYPSWDLKQGQRVKAIISCGNGFLRYKMEDLLEVSGFEKKVPYLNFLGRDKTVDLVGEKISFDSASMILEQLRRDFPASDCFCLFAVRGTQSGFYALLLSSDQDGLLEKFENELCKNFHYKVARELKQLKESRLAFSAKPRQSYLKLFKNRGMAEGDLKLEPLVLITEEEWLELQRKI